MKRLEGNSRLYKRPCVVNKTAGQGRIISIPENREHPSNLLDYFIPNKEMIEKRLTSKLLANY
ncbi:MAG: hypothetical protein QXZ47_05495 [Candidatus Bathyarchaeia archaeon]